MCLQRLSLFHQPASEEGDHHCNEGRTIADCHAEPLAWADCRERIIRRLSSAVARSRVAAMAKLICMPVTKVAEPAGSRAADVRRETSRRVLQQPGTCTNSAIPHDATEGVP